MTIWAWIETSSAETGSSATRNSGSMIAHGRCRCAGAVRPRIRAEALGHSAPASPTTVSSSRDFLVALAPGAGRAGGGEGSDEDLPHRHARIEGGERILEDQLHTRAQRAQRRGEAGDVPALESDAARVGRSGAARPGRAWSCPSRSRPQGPGLALAMLKLDVITARRPVCAPKNPPPTVKHLCRSATSRSGARHGWTSSCQRQQRTYCPPPAASSAGSARRQRAGSAWRSVARRRSPAASGADRARCPG